MFAFFNALYPEKNEVPKKINLSKPHVKYGITTTITSWISGKFGKLKGQRNNAFLGNEATLLANNKGRLLLDVGIFDGLSGDVIGPDGNLSAELASEKLAKTPIGRSDAFNSVGLLNDYGSLTNNISPIYNMLRMMIIKGYKDIEYDPSAKFYDNGHVLITNEQAFGHTTKINFGNSIKILDQEIELSYPGGAASSISNDCQVYINMGGVVDGAVASILRMAFAEWTTSAPFGVSHSSPRLSKTLTFPNAVPKGRGVDWESLNLGQIKAVLMDYVARHKAYRDFEIAYGMLVSIIVRPVPRSAEAVAWAKPCMDINMPMPVVLSGIFPQLYTGTPYTKSPDWMDCYSSWVNSPMACVPHSIAFNEAIYAELYHLSNSTVADKVDITNFTQHTLQTNNAPSEGIIADLCLACTRYGRQYDVRYLTSAGPDRLNSLPSPFVTPVEITIKDDQAPQYYKLKNIRGDKAEIDCDEFMPIVYPSMSYGVNEDPFYLNGTTAEIKFNSNTSNGTVVFTDTVKFSHFMSMMRMAGWDVKAYDVMRETWMTNWADNASGRYLYHASATQDDTKITIKREDIKRRKNFWLQMPEFYGEVTMGYSMEGALVTWLSDDKKMTFPSGYAPDIKRSDYDTKVKTMMQDRTAFKIIPLVKSAQSFHRAVYEIASSRPILAPTSVSLDTGPQILEPISEQAITETL
jgi:hypothetical protein